MGLTGSQIDALTFIEQTYWEEGAVPTNEAVAEHTGIRVETIRSYWEESDFVTALDARGVGFRNTADSKSLTMEQLMVANMVMSTTDRRSLREKCKSAEIPIQRVNGWMRQPAFQEHLKRRAATLYEHAEPIAYRELVKAIEAGDTQMLKFFFEMKGIYNPRVQVDVNIELVLVRVVEIIARHVQDPATLQAIAGELEVLDSLPSRSPTPGALPPPSSPVIPSDTVLQI